VRPVSDRPSEEVSERERQYEDGSDPQVLDIVDVPLLKPNPKAFQSENWLLDPKTYWAKHGELKWSRLATFADPAGPLWINGRSTYNGINDEMPLEAANKLNSSLKLIHVTSMELKVFAPKQAFGDSKRRVQGSFQLAKQKYALWVTDPRWEKEYLAMDNGDYAIGGSYLTISVGESFKGCCYKLIAAIISKPGK